MNLFKDYFNNADGGHNTIDSWAWWAWNANSGDTGGVVRCRYLPGTAQT